VAQLVGYGVARLVRVRRGSVGSMSATELFSDDGMERSLGERLWM
jgi:hypothetical protein